MKIIRNIGVIGHGFVGRAVATHFAKFFPVNIYDKVGGTEEEKGAAYNSDVVFVCVPTPTVNGEQDLSAVFEVFEGLADRDGLYILKSTVVPGTWEKIRRISPTLAYCVYHSPEFLSARTAEEDFANQQYILLGGDTNEYLIELVDVFKRVFPGIPVWTTSAAVTELVKYMANNFYAVKISFMNEMSEICEAVGVDFNDVKKLALLQGWINPMHTDVPGHDGQLGWGGSCFPKDLRAMIHFAEDLGLDPIMLQATLDKNVKLRGSE